jgi:phospholipid transport system transporter-binding protein
MQLPENATLNQAAALAAALPAALAAEGTGPFTVDATLLKAFDSSTLALLLQAHRLAHAAGRGFRVQDAPAQLMQLATLYGVQDLLALEPGPVSPVPPPIPVSASA